VLYPPNNARRNSGASIQLDASLDAIRSSATINARLVAATDDELKAAIVTVGTMLAHPILQRAAASGVLDDRLPDLCAQNSVRAHRHINGSIRARVWSVVRTGVCKCLDIGGDVERLDIDELADLVACSTPRPIAAQRL
jgi:hypothetical protein